MHACCSTCARVSVCARSVARSRACKLYGELFYSIVLYSVAYIATALGPGNAEPYCRRRLRHAGGNGQEGPHAKRSKADGRATRLILGIHMQHTDRPASVARHHWGRDADGCLLPRAKFAFLDLALLRTSAVCAADKRGCNGGVEELVSVAITRSFDERWCRRLPSLRWTLLKMSFVALSRAASLDTSPLSASSRSFCCCTCSLRARSSARDGCATSAAILQARRTPMNSQQDVPGLSACVMTQPQTAVGVGDEGGHNHART